MIARSPQLSGAVKKNTKMRKLGSFPSELTAIHADFLLRSTGRFAAPHPLIPTLVPIVVETKTGSVRQVFGGNGGKKTCLQLKPAS